MTLLERLTNDLLELATDEELAILEAGLGDEYFPGARPTQRPPDGDWSTWLIQSGRGWGKTRTGAEWTADNALTRPHSRWAVVTATFADGRDTCIEGESGLLEVLRRRRPHIDWDDRWNRSLGELFLPNRSHVKLFSSEKPNRLRGPQHHGAWCDEAAAWENAVATWDNLQFGLRLGPHPRAVVTTTPQPTKLIKALVADDSTIVTRGATYDNAANLPPSQLAKLRRVNRPGCVGGSGYWIPTPLWSVCCAA